MKVALVAGINSVLLALGLCGIWLGCGPSTPRWTTVPMPADNVMPSAAVLIREGVQIEAIDSPWNIEPNVPMRPPFVTNWMPEEGNVTSERVADFINKGTKVRIRVPGRSEPLYGLLVFFPVSSLADGAVKRIYRIDVPDSYVSQAIGGFVSTVYQPYDISYVNQRSNQGGQQTRNVTLVSWALWMSDVPALYGVPTSHTGTGE